MGGWEEGAKPKKRKKKSQPKPKPKKRKTKKKKTGKKKKKKSVPKPKKKKNTPDVEEKSGDIPPLEADSSLSGDGDDDEQMPEDSDEDDMIVMLSEFNPRMDWDDFADKVQNLLLKRDMWEVTETRQPNLSAKKFMEQQELAVSDRVYSVFFSLFCFMHSLRTVIHIVLKEEVIPNGKEDVIRLLHGMDLEGRTPSTMGVPTVDRDVGRAYLWGYPVENVQSFNRKITTVPEAPATDKEFHLFGNVGSIRREFIAKGFLKTIRGNDASLILTVDICCACLVIVDPTKLAKSIEAGNFYTLDEVRVLPCVFFHFRAGCVRFCVILNEAEDVSVLDC